MARRDSFRYETALRLIRQWHVEYNSRARRERSTFSAFDGDLFGALGDGVCFDYEYDEFKMMQKLVELAQREGRIHQDAVRIFENDTRIVVRRPDCISCGEPWDQHADDDKCFFASTHYLDS